MLIFNRNSPRFVNVHKSVSEMIRQQYFLSLVRVFPSIETMVPNVKIIEGGILIDHSLGVFIPKKRKGSF